MMKLTSLIFCLSVLILSVTLPNRVPHWQWTHITIDNLTLPDIMGVANAEFQVSGARAPSNWDTWQNTLFHQGRPTILNHETAGQSCDFWGHYEEDIMLAKSIGCNAFRFSVDWATIQPEEGVYDEEALLHYDRLVDVLLREELTPMVTLHHFVHPEWFESKGGFEKRENVGFFVEFAKVVFERYCDKIDLWITFNEPNVVVFQGYLHAEFPPGKTDFGLAAAVMKNLMVAHVETYRTLKGMRGGDKAQIGYAHSYTPAVARNYFNPIEHILAWIVDYTFNGAVLHFFKTGELFPYFPWWRETIPKDQVVNSIDFIGINYYSHIVLETQFTKASILSRNNISDLNISRFWQYV
eukprot:TRINITY_DN1797_c0_g1_i2.p1 TRINITY_DN1797_c0_g1~~TRINITY_DN1797_c0_g1_i2.p1  ORF type:complete len:353 (-),score=62.92 TRINITY_DN1797_c0_g1_i2:422-1480(-)